MKNIIVKICLLSLLLTSCGYWINPRYVRMSNKTKEKFALPELINISEYYTKKEKVYSVNTSKLRELILESKYRNV